MISWYRSAGLSKIALFAVVGCLQACNTSSFDVDYNDEGEPTAYKIVNRINCELADLVRKNDEGNYIHGYAPYLISQDFDIELILSLDINNTGGLTPSLKYTNPFSSATSFAFPGAATLQEGREDNFAKTITFPLSNIITKLKEDNKAFTCPAEATNLAGSQGINRIVELGLSIPDDAQSVVVSTPGKFDQRFGGSIQYIVTTSLSGVGPTWTLTNFTGPGGMLGLSRVSTNKLTIGFGSPESGGAAPAVPVPKPPKPGAKATPAVVKTLPRPNPKLDLFMNTLTGNQLNSQIQQILQNTNH